MRRELESLQRRPGQDHPRDTTHRIRRDSHLPTLLSVSRFQQPRAQCRTLVRGDTKVKVAQHSALLIKGFDPLEDGPLPTLPGYDPYRWEVDDPSKCQALDSSLYELELLRDHYSPAVSRLLEMFETDLDRLERDHPVDQLLESNYHKVIHRSLSHL